MTDPKIVATYYTLAGDAYPGKPVASPFPLERRAAAAVAAGYYGMGLSGDDLAANVALHGTAGIRRILDDAGVQFLEIECLTDWFAQGDARAASDKMRRLWLDTAVEIGTGHIKVVGDLSDSGVSMESMAADFRLLCDQAAHVGAHVSIEVFPLANIRDLTSGRQLIEQAGAANGGLLIDIWHMTRPGIPYEEVAALPVEYIKHVELDDAAAEVVGHLFDDSTDNRLLPGEGSFDVPAFLRAIAATGYDGCYGIEMLSHEFRALEPEEAARRSFDAVARQFALAREEA